MDIIQMQIGWKNHVDFFSFYHANLCRISLRQNKPLNPKKIPRNFLLDRVKKYFEQFDLKLKNLSVA